MHIDNVRTLLDNMDVEALIISQKSTKKYVGSMTGSGVWTILTKDNQIQIMDGRYETESLEFQKCFRTVVTPQGSVFEGVISWIAANNIKKIAIENKISISQYNCLKSLVDIQLVDDQINLIRSKKDDSEISNVKKACNITDLIFTELIKKIEVGMTENELVGELYRLVYRHGAEGVSFEPVVSSGNRTAMPHGRATNKVLENGDFLIIDFGVIENGYQSDMTRTVSVGEMTDQFRNIYERLLPIQEETITQFVPGEIGKDIHNFAKSRITDIGYGEYFPHGLGHGLGIGDSERPLMNATSNDILGPNMIGTCEPGIYIPGLGGIRIEDDILVTENEPIVLNKTSKQLLVVG